MSDTHDGGGSGRTLARPAVNATSLDVTAPDPGRCAPRILIVDADAALCGLLDAWLRERGYTLMQSHAEHCPATDRYDLVIIDVPFPRHAGMDAVRRMAREQPQTPILVLSSSFFAGIDPRGAVARSLGVDTVLPKPLGREALLDAVGRILGRP